jgi:hypothetical protein
MPDRRSERERVEITSEDVAEVSAEALLGKRVDEAVDVLGKRLGVGPAGGPALESGDPAKTGGGLAIPEGLRPGARVVVTRLDHKPQDGTVVSVGEGVAVVQIDGQALPRLLEWDEVGVK